MGRQYKIEVLDGDQLVHQTIVLSKDACSEEHLKKLVQEQRPETVGDFQWKIDPDPNLPEPPSTAIN